MPIRRATVGFLFSRPVWRGESRAERSCLPTLRTCCVTFGSFSPSLRFLSLVCSVGTRTGWGSALQGPHHCTACNFSLGWSSHFGFCLAFSLQCIVGAQLSFVVELNNARWLSESPGHYFWAFSPCGTPSCWSPFHMRPLPGSLSQFPPVGGDCWCSEHLVRGSRVAPVTVYLGVRSNTLIPNEDHALTRSQAWWGVLYMQCLIWSSTTTLQGRYYYYPSLYRTQAQRSEVTCPAMRERARIWNQVSPCLFFKRKEKALTYTW